MYWMIFAVQINLISWSFCEKSISLEKHLMIEYIYIATIMYVYIAFIDGWGTIYIYIS